MRSKANCGGTWCVSSSVGTVLSLWLCSQVVLGSEAAVSGWRGDGTGVFRDTSPPVEWSAKTNVVWNVPLPSWSNGSPTLAGDHLFAVCEKKGLICLSKANGKPLWTSTYSPGRTGGHKEVGATTPTPVVDMETERVTVFFANGWLGTYDFTGTLLWSTNLHLGASSRGHTSSPLLCDGTLVVCHGNLTGFEAATGKAKWSVKSKARQGSPVIASIGSQSCVVTPNGQLVSLSDGVVRSTELPRLQYSSPIVHQGIVYAVGVGDCKSVACALPDTVDGRTSLLWETEIKKGRYFGSPVLHEGYLFGIRQSGTVVVLDVKTGQKLREHRFDQMHQTKGQCYPSLAIAGNRLHVSSDNGTTLVLEPKPQLRVLAENQLERTRACAAFQGRCMYVRGMEKLWCLGE